MQDGQQIEFREPTGDELERIKELDLLLYSFQQSDEERYYVKRKQADFLLSGILSDGTVAVSLRVYPFHGWIGGSRYKIAGLGHIACQPHLRRRGYTSRLIKRALHESRKRGYQLAYVWPFSHEFYRKLGFELVERTTSYSFFPEQLPTSNAQRFVKPIEEEQFDQLNKFYRERVLPNNCGLVERDIDDWLDLLRTDHRIYGFVRGSVQGYMVAEFEVLDPTSQRIKIKEIYGSNEAVEGMWSYVNSLQDQFREANYVTDLREPFHLRIEDPRRINTIQKLGGVESQQSLNFGFMSRIVDFKQAFSVSRNFNDAHGEVLLKLNDTSMPTNHSHWMLRFSEGEPMVEEVVTENTEKFPHSKMVETDISTLTALFMGAYRPSVLAEYGRIKTDSKRALDLLRQAFDTTLPRLHTYF